MHESLQNAWSSSSGGHPATTLDADLFNDHALAPNLFVIGASKSGTSALHAYLRYHPKICMSREKEPCFFVAQNELERLWPIMARRPCSHDREAYLDLWNGGEAAQYRGEASVYYAQAPSRSGVAARIAAAAPGARIIYVVREPVSRALAHYWQRYKEFQEPLPIERAMRENPLYRDTSDYAMQIEQYLAHFAPEQIHVIVAEDLKVRRRDTLADCFRWLGLENFAYDEEQLSDRHRSPPTSRRQRFPFVSGIRNSSIWARARKSLPAPVVDGLRAMSTVRFDKHEVDEGPARAYLEDYLTPRRVRFEALIGRRIDAW
ncbi:sulfotransferase domain-containing protein [Novosphingobium sp. 1949]|uniref:Sulfotransferase domain-containing protein n=1 Tax=Novosphingobium organovorum TaxID=2930092 RepID=A0ABT0BG62_9SPHN|nr:sulfotransferase [Novosphingobium organovorum]MCJ2183915.1 sulfotransferase domain-containing protein [Novosphingobium organovorum]